MEGALRFIPSLPTHMNFGRNEALTLGSASAAATAQRLRCCRLPGIRRRRNKKKKVKSHYNCTKIYYVLFAQQVFSLQSRAQ